MKRLLWKEIREQSVWGAIWLLSLILLATLGRAQSVHGTDPRLWNTGTTFVMLISMVVGAGAYGSEITGSRAEFICTLPVSWRRLLCAKLLFAALVVGSSALVSAAILRMTLPEAYAPLATPANALIGAVPLMAVAWTSYLIGACFSLILPGVPGGVVALSAAFLAVLIAFAASFNLRGPDGISPLWPFTGGLLGAFVGALAIVRSHLTLALRARLIRFASVFLGCLVVVWAIGMLSPVDVLNFRMPRAYQQIQFSPDGRYVAALTGRSYSTLWDVITCDDCSLPDGAFVIRLDDRKVVRLPDQVAACDPSWCGPDTIACRSDNKQILYLRVRDDGSIERTSPPSAPAGTAIHVSGTPL